MKYTAFLLLSLIAMGCNSQTNFKDLHFGPGPEDEKYESGVIEDCEGS